MLIKTSSNGSKPDCGSHIIGDAEKSSCAVVIWIKKLNVASANLLPMRNWSPQIYPRRQPLTARAPFNQPERMMRTPPSPNPKSVDRVFANVFLYVAIICSWVLLFAIIIWNFWMGVQRQHAPFLLQDISRERQTQLPTESTRKNKLPDRLPAVSGHVQAKKGDGNASRQIFG